MYYCSRLIGVGVLSSKFFPISLSINPSISNMEEENHETAMPTSSHPTLIDTHRSNSSPSTPTTSSSSSSSEVLEEGVNHQHHYHHHQPQQERRSFYYRVNFTVSNVVLSDSADDVWSSLGVVVTFCFFASIFLIIGFHGSVNLQLGSNYSRLLLASPLFVNKIKVEDMTKSEPGLNLYGFNEVPSLDVETAWSEAHDASLATHSYKEWLYYLNEGSEVNITYNVKSQSSHLYLAIAQGKEDLLQWLREPTYPNITLLWDIIHGSGMVQQKISTASDYYVVVGNLNQEEMEVQLNFSIRAILYNTTDSYLKCSLAHGACSLKLYLTKKSAAVITAPGPPEGKPMDEMYVRLSYEPRWTSYFIGSGVMTLLILLVSKFCAKCYPISGNGVGQMGSERTPLLVPKDEDLLSLGSSYDSVSNDEADIEEWFIAAKELGGEDNGSPRLVCLVCFDTPRDCFFLPCGHSATCFPCGSRIAEDEAGTCPICHRKMKKVRRILTV